jgi:Integrin plexin domain
MKMYGVAACLLLLWVGSSYQQEQYLVPEKLVVQNPCVSKQTCGECIQTPSCAWCSQPVKDKKNYK